MNRVARWWAWAKGIDSSVGDALLAGVVAVLAVITVLVQDTSPGYEDPGFVALALAFATAVPMAWRRRRPLLVLLVSGGLMTTLLLLDYPEGILPVALLMLTYTVAANCPTRPAVAGLVYILSLIILLAVADTPGLGTGATVSNFAIYTCAWVIGLVVRSRRAETFARLAEMEERAEVQRQESARALAEERLRIAQELHDVVAHSMSVIAVQAGVGAHVLETQPDEARRSLEAISTTSRATLSEMRRLLGVLRGEDGQRSHAPAPGLDDISALVRDVASTGVDVSVDMQGDRGCVPPGVDLSAYRVVQEALTNVIKHAGSGVSAHVAVGCASDEITIDVVDDGRGAAATGTSTGHGLMGMRERVAVWGGELLAGPRPGGGYRVHARIPFGDDR